MRQEHLIVRPDVVATRGIRRGLVADLAKGRYYLVPNSLVTFVRRQNKKKIPDILAAHSAEDAGTAMEYVDWLTEKGLAFLCGDPHFAKNVGTMEFNWSTPHEITNCLLELGERNYGYLEEIVQKLSAFRVPFVELRIFRPAGMQMLCTALELFQESDIKHLSVIACYSDELNIRAVKRGLKYVTVLNAVTFFSAGFDRNFFIHSGTTPVRYLSQPLSNCSCGKFGPDHFYPNSEFYSESQRHNSCLNRKLAITENGEIKNCLSLKKTYGHICEISLEEALASDGFKEMWNITKAQINICKVCEFRNICSDCRAFLQDPADHYSKPLKCGYDPYTGEWKEWHQNPGNRQSLSYYNFQEPVNPGV